MVQGTKDGLDQCGVCNRIIAKTGWRSGFLIIVKCMGHCLYYRWNWIHGDRQSVVPLASLPDAFSVVVADGIVRHSYLAISWFILQVLWFNLTSRHQAACLHTLCYTSSVPYSMLCASRGSSSEPLRSQRGTAFMHKSLCIAYCRSFMCWINNGQNSDKMAHNHTMWYQYSFNQQVGNSGTHNPCPSCHICLANFNK